jgi:hypothetical protein
MNLKKSRLTNIKPTYRYAIFLIIISFSCAPVIESFTPERGPISTQVTIIGKRLGADPSETIVKFAGIEATEKTVITPDEKITAKVPAGARSGLISVTVDGRTVQSEKNFVVETNASAEWTFLVYMDSDNNLEYAGIDDFLEMASVGSTQDVNIVIQMDRIAGYSSSHGNWTGTRRFLIKQGDDPGMTAVQDLGEANMGDPDVLRDFVEWAVTNYPADHYALSIWNHGDGWRMMRERMQDTALNRIAIGNQDVAVTRAVSSDDTDNDILYMKEVQNALEAAKPMIKNRNGAMVKLDVIGFDACLMGMIEVAFALRDVAHFMVGSEELEPGDGWPYNTILGNLTDSPSSSALDVSGIIVNNYGDAYSSGITQSSVEIAQVHNVCFKIDQFANAMNTEWAAIQRARNNAKTYHPSGFSSGWGVDLFDFADKVSNEVSSNDIKTAAQELKRTIQDFVRFERHSNDMDGSHGIAIYFPPTQTAFNNDPDHTAYQESNSFMPVDFVNTHYWDNWLLNYYLNTN